MDFLPIFLRLHGQPCLLVGGGATAMRKARLLLRAGADLTVVAPQMCESLTALASEGALRHVAEPFAGVHLEGMRLVIAATNDAAVNRRVAELADQAGILCNVVDDLEACRFIMPAIVDRSPLMVAISSAGSAPVLVRMLREKFERLLPARLGELARLASRWRARVKQALPAGVARRRFWESAFEGPVADHMMAGRSLPAERALSAALREAQRDSIDNRLPEGKAGIAWLVGAGPGDPGLLTLRALQIAQQADVILYDRLVSDEILELTRRDADRICVGKKPGEPCMTQAQISALLVKLVAQGRRVCRLKGGDPFIFGRGGEEAEALVAAGLPFEVVPGVTAAAACGAYAGIPLTHRDHSQSVVLITAHGKASIDRLDWRSLARDQQTLAFYMGVSRLGDIRDHLLAHGRAGATPVALVENGTTRAQRVIRGQLAELPELAMRHNVSAPAMLFVGEVAGLAGRLSWFQADEVQAPIETLEPPRDETSAVAVC
ncbi:MAG: uroporphyrinogen-III C-methyltransferase [Gammaproteobacteria bacterium]|nr:uroporphyrinogen-III C-methyltransferase [Gammaproteobacteria bacterium]